MVGVLRKSEIGGFNFICVCRRVVSLGVTVTVRAIGGRVTLNILRLGLKLRLVLATARLAHYIIVIIKWVRFKRYVIISHYNWATATNTSHSAPAIIACGKIQLLSLGLGKSKRISERHCY